jgi:hypothetical protein
MTAMKTLLIIASLLALGCVSESSRLSQYPILVVPENEQSMYVIDGIEFSTRTRNFNHEIPQHRFIFEPLEISKIPKETVHYTEWLIAKRFFPDPIHYADRFAGVTIANYKEEIIFDLLLTKEVDEANKPTGNWIYYLTVAQKPNGKRFSIAEFTVSAKNEILENYKFKW